jgi:sugar phosphate isomerase/epimerase
MRACANPSTAGRQMEFPDYLKAASAAGFRCVDMDGSAVKKYGLQTVKEWLKEYGLSVGAAGLPAPLNRTDEEFREALPGVREQAELLQALGVTRMVTWLPPSGDALPFLFACDVVSRARACAGVLENYGLRLGLEFVGPYHLRGGRYPYLHSLPQTIRLLDAIDRENVGVLLDSYHWYANGGDPAELRQLPLSRIVHVHINDTDKSPEEAHDFQRLLPGEGRIDLAAFVGYLAESGYDGPLSVEVLRQEPPKEEPEVVIVDRARLKKRSICAVFAVFMLLLAAGVAYGFHMAALNPVTRVRPDRLVVIVTSRSAQGQKEARRVFAGIGPVGHLYSSLLLVPPETAGVKRDCPEEVKDGEYSLTFFHGQTVVLQATAEAGGCLDLSLSSGKKLDGTSDQGVAFYAALDDLLGVKRGSTIDDPVS